MSTEDELIDILRDLTRYPSVSAGKQKKHVPNRWQDLINTIGSHSREYPTSFFYVEDGTGLNVLKHDTIREELANFLNTDIVLDFPRHSPFDERVSSPRVIKNKDKYTINIYNIHTFLPMIVNPDNTINIANRIDIKINNGEVCIHNSYHSLNQSEVTEINPSLGAFIEMFNNKKHMVFTDSDRDTSVKKFKKLLNKTWSTVNQYIMPMNISINDQKLMVNKRLHLIFGDNCYQITPDIAKKYFNIVNFENGIYKYTGCVRFMCPLSEQHSNA